MNIIVQRYHLLMINKGIINLQKLINSFYIVIEFKHYGYSDLLRNFVGASKISTSAFLILGLWYNEITLYASLSMAFFMLCAQLSHIKVKNPFIKFVPSLIFLCMSLFIASYNCGLI